MDTKANQTSTLTRILIGLGVGFILVAVWLFFSPPTQLSINTVNETATLHFSLSPSKRFLANGCTDITWNADHIQEIYLNNAGTVGSGEQQLCNTNVATFRVVFSDSTTKIYTLVSEITSWNVLYWLLAITGVALLVYSIAPLRNGLLIVTENSQKFAPIFGVGLFLILISIHVFDPVMIPPAVDQNQSLEARAMALDPSQRIAIGRKIAQITPPDSVIFVPLGVGSPSSMYVFAYPRLFLYAGNVRDYMKTYLGNPQLSYVNSALANAQRLTTPLPTHLYLLINRSMLDSLKTLTAGSALDLGQPDYVLWGFDKSVPVENIDAIVSKVQGGQSPDLGEITAEDN